MSAYIKMSILCKRKRAPQAASAARGWFVGVRNDVGARPTAAHAFMPIGAARVMSCSRPLHLLLVTLIVVLLLLLIIILRTL